MTIKLSEFNIKIFLFTKRHFFVLKTWSFRHTKGLLKACGHFCGCSDCVSGKVCKFEQFDTCNKSK